MAFIDFKKTTLLLLIALFQCAVLVSARPHADSGSLVTNAKRMQAGLGPLKPRRLYNPSRVAPRDPTPSAVISYGNILVKRADGTEVGYISTQDYGDVTTGSDKAEVSFNPANPPFNIAVSGMAFPDLGFLGYSALSTNGNSLSMIATNPTAPGAPPAKVGTVYGTGYASASAVWNYSPTDHQFTVQWVNPDGTVLFPSFGYASGSNRVYITLVPGDSQVFLYLV